jgi:hypothetical protein
MVRHVETVHRWPSQLPTTLLLQRPPHQASRLPKAGTISISQRHAARSLAGSAPFNGAPLVAEKPYVLPPRSDQPASDACPRVGTGATIRKRRVGRNRRTLSASSRFSRCAGILHRFPEHRSWSARWSAMFDVEGGQTFMASLLTCNAYCRVLIDGQLVLEKAGRPAFEKG